MIKPIVFCRDNAHKKNPAPKSGAVDGRELPWAPRSEGTFGSSPYRITRQGITSFHPEGPYSRRRLPWRPHACDQIFLTVVKFSVFRRKNLTHLL